jgi:hypothetical protein
MTREYTMDLLARRTDSVEPCKNCSLQYRCDANRLACTQFRFFVNTGRMPVDTARYPTREIYIDLFHNEPAMPARKERA